MPGLITPSNTAGVIVKTGDFVSIVTSGYESMGVQVAGIYTGVLAYQVTLDGQNWITHNAETLLNLNTGQSTNTIASGATGIWRTEVPALRAARIIALGAFSGSATVTVSAATGAGSTITYGPTYNYRLLSSAASVNAASVKDATARLYKIVCHPQRTTDFYLKLYDTAGVPDVGADTPKATIVMPGQGTPSATGQLLQVDWTAAPLAIRQRHRSRVYQCRSRYRRHTDRRRRHDRLQSILFVRRT